jgi:Caenorhabditis protein of unknown function, DUF268
MGAGRVVKRWLRPLIQTNIGSGLRGYQRFIRDWRAYRRMQNAEPILFRNTYPQLFDNMPGVSAGGHYFYQDIWAFTKIHSSRVDQHVDVGSNVLFVGFLSAITNIVFVDIRPLDAPYLRNFKSTRGSILEMPYESGAIKSLSCLHVAEHIGLGRYGDPLDPLGTKKAAAELSRCLAKSGNLYFSVPVGKPRVCFNAHRIHSPSQILSYFPDLTLVEFSVYDDDNRFIEKTDVKLFENCKYGCGMFYFTKR